MFYDLLWCIIIFKKDITEKVRLVVLHGLTTIVAGAAVCTAYS